MNVLDIVSQKFSEFIASETGKKLTQQVVQAALAKLLPQKDGQIDLASIVKGMDAQGLMGIAQSWLGDGKNESVTGDTIKSLLGEANVEAFAKQLGLDKDKAVAGLQQIVPDLVDKSSSGGKLTPDAVGSVLGALGSFLK